MDCRQRWSPHGRCRLRSEKAELGGAGGCLVAVGDTELAEMLLRWVLRVFNVMYSSAAMSRCFILRGR